MKFKFNKKKFEDDLFTIYYIGVELSKWIGLILLGILLAFVITYYPSMFILLLSILLTVWLVSMFIKRYFVEVVDDANM